MMRVPTYIAALKPYEPGKPIAALRRETGLEHIIKLASNENPLGPSPRALAAMQAALAQVHVYPDDGPELRAALAARLNRQPENILLGGGSDSLMLSIVRVFVTEGGEVISADGSFPQYWLMPQSRGATVRLAKLKNYCYDLDAIADLVTPRTQLIFLANPNNPTGTIFQRAAWEKFYARIPPHVMIVCDEAYAEFAAHDPQWPDSLQYAHDNIITLRTFSKAYGLAGVRLGYAIAAPEIIRELSKVKLPFEPSSLALAAGEAAWDDAEFLERTLTLNCAQYAIVTAALDQMGIAYVPSHANFVMIHFRDATTMQRVNTGLLAQGVILRPLTASGFPSSMRMTIGLPAENARCLDVMKTLL